jgi:hypothetical protein
MIRNFANRLLKLRCGTLGGFSLHIVNRPVFSIQADFGVRQILLRREASEEEKERNAAQGHRSQRGMSRAEALAELRKGKPVSKAALLRCRVRYFTDGLVLGSRDFVEKVFQEKRSWFGPKRMTGARSLSLEDKSLFSLRTIKVQALE